MRQDVLGLRHDLLGPGPACTCVGLDARSRGVIDHPGTEGVEARTRDSGRVGAVLGATLDDQAAQPMREGQVEAQHEHALALGGESSGTGGERERLAAPWRTCHARIFDPFGLAATIRASALSCTGVTISCDTPSTTSW